MRSRWNKTINTKRLSVYNLVCRIYYSFFVVNILIWMLCWLSPLDNIFTSLYHSVTTCNPSPQQGQGIQYCPIGPASQMHCQSDGELVWAGEEKNFPLLCLNTCSVQMTVNDWELQRTQKDTNALTRRSGSLIVFYTLRSFSVCKLSTSPAHWHSMTFGINSRTYVKNSTSSVIPYPLSLIDR